MQLRGGGQRSPRPPKRGSTQRTKARRQAIAHGTERGAARALLRRARHRQDLAEETGGCVARTRSSGAFLAGAQAAPTPGGRVRALHGRDREDPIPRSACCNATSMQAARSGSGFGPADEFFPLSATSTPSAPWWSMPIQRRGQGACQLGGPPRHRVRCRAPTARARGEDTVGAPNRHLGALRSGSDRPPTCCLWHGACVVPKNSSAGNWGPEERTSAGEWAATR